MVAKTDPLDFFVGFMRIFGNGIVYLYRRA